MDPINYILDVKNPIEEAIKGYTMGRNDIAQRQEMQIQQQNASMQQQAFADQQRALAEQRAAAAKQQAEAAALQNDLTGLKEVARVGALTQDQINKFAMTHAQSFDQFKTAFSAQSDAQKASQTSFGVNLATSLLGANPEVGVKLLEERIAAAEASGNSDEANKLKANLEIAKFDPHTAGVSMLATMAATGAVDSALVKSIVDATQGPKAAEAASPLGKISQDVNNGILPQSVLDSAIKLDKANAVGGLTLKDKISEEARLRGEYTTRTQGLTDAERNFGIIQISAVDDTGAGDIALVTSFMKMLDPGSVVRETEFATAANAGGLLARLKSLASKVESGKFLSPEQRTEFQSLSKKYLDAAQTQEQGVKESYQAIVDNYGLNPINVFGVQGARVRYDENGNPIP